jgi:GT2 family glycosyltransferase
LKNNNNSPLIYIIVLSYNAFEDISLCIDSLTKCTYPNLEILIVDNCSTDGTKERLNKKYPQLNIISSGYNGGYAAGMNYGAKYALEKNAEYILVLNQDTEVTPGFLQPMVDAMERDSQIGIVSPKVGYTDAKDIIYCAGGILNKWKCVAECGFQGKPFNEYANNDRYLDDAEGCGFLVRAEVFRNVGFLNEKFFMYFEDIEFSSRVLTKYKILYCSSSVIYHKSGGGKSWRAHSPIYSYYFNRNRLYYYKNAPFYYKMYVLFFSTLNILAKTVFLLGNKTSLFSLWRGYKDGLQMFLGAGK